MRTICALVVLSLAAGAAWADDKDDVTAAAKKAAELTNYTFKGETKTELPAMMGGGGDPQKFEGKHDKDSGTMVRTDTQEFVTVGGKTASRPIAEWKLVKEEDAMGMARRGMGLGSSSRPPKAPHEVLGKLGSRFKKVKKSKKESVAETECDLFEAELSESGAGDTLKELVPAIGQWLEHLPDAETTGSSKVWVNADGCVVKYEMTAKISASVQGMELEITATRTITLSEIGKTKVEVPDDAKKALEKGD